jgi:hypothetical protein
MQIISKIRDYYDSGAMYGIDKSVVYERKPTLIEQSHPWYKTLQGRISVPYVHNRVKSSRYITYNTTPELKGRLRSLRYIPYTIHSISIIVAGKEYCGSLVEKDILEGGISTSKEEYYFFWRTRDVLDWLKNIIPEEYYNEQEIYELNFSRRPITEADDFCIIDVSEAIRDFMLENRIVSITADIRKTFRSTDIVVNSDNLVLYKLQKVVSAEQMFQNIDQWISMMNDPTRQMVEISNQSKIDKHGLDKWSFRNKPIDG